MQTHPNAFAKGGQFATELRRVAVRVSGLVQGVGFRPHVWRLAQRHALTGHVLNDCEGVLAEVQGHAIEAFLCDLEAEAPPLAQIDRIEVTRRPPVTAEAAFYIRESARDGRVATAITADACICDACLAELFDPSSRRRLYPFLTCTHCGPRLSVTRRLPYERAETSLDRFPLCEPCAGEYGDPGDRRFHAETTCCPACGPRLTMPVTEIAERLARGEIVAVKGIGGFHLMCDARREEAVGRLRAGKHRDGKPFAVMVLNASSAAAIARIDPVSAKLLQSRERPVVVVAQRRANGLPAGVSGGLPTIGIFLPYTPLHYLLFWHLAGRPEGLAWLDAPLPAVLVATSANISGEPLIADDDEASTRLAGIASAVAGHDRAIVVRIDDSVMRVIAGAPSFIRRARGFTPAPVRLAHNVAPVLALGAALKATVTVTRGSDAFVSQHVGDLDNAAAAAFHARTVSHLLGILDVEPVAIAHDLHPDFASTRLAGEIAMRSGCPTIPIQHHHAHIAAVAAEHRQEQPLLGLALDGFGLGPPCRGGTRAWGGELLLVHGHRWRRLGHFLELAEPGGDRAAREPWRMAAAALHALGRGPDILRRFADEPLAPSLARLLQTGHVATTSSAGRLFDAAAGLLGVCRRQTFEGEAAMRLEALATQPSVLQDGWSVADDWTLDFMPLLQVLADRGETLGAVWGANLFHGTLAAALAEWVRSAAARFGVSTVALGGGCFLNGMLTEYLVSRLRQAGLIPLLARSVPPNDGGLSLGQAWIAACCVAAGEDPQKLEEPECVMRCR